MASGAQRMEYVAGAQDEGKKLKSVLRGALEMSSSLISRVKLLDDGIMLNGQRAFTNAVVHSGDVVSVRIADEPSPGEVEPMEFPLDIVFEDEYIVVINKPGDMAVHPSVFLKDKCTVANAMAAYLGEGSTFHPVNRLDRGTTGLMTVAKSAYVHELLRRRLHTGEFCREYRAVVIGVPEPASGMIEMPIAREAGSVVKREISDDGDPSRTYYEVLSVKDGRAFVRLRPFTGRTHQLRVHMAAIGHPLAGDWLYGTEDRELIARPALHSYMLSVRHPVTGESLELTAPIPPDMAALI